MTLVDFALIAIHGVIVYAWILFPALLALLRPRHSPGAARPPAGDTPHLAILISAYEEEASIGDRIRNLLEQDYPRAYWTAYIGVDGSRDRTGSEALAAAAGHDAIRVFEFPENRGKVAVLKDLVARACAATPPPELMVFTDANTSFLDRDALRRLYGPFSDAAIGGVCGKLLFTKGKGNETEENVYWRLETWLKVRESAIDSCLGANGAIYAIRSFLFWREIPVSTIIDDFVIGMKVREKNYRMVYEPRAVAVGGRCRPGLRTNGKGACALAPETFQALRLCVPCLKPSFGAFCVGVLVPQSPAMVHAPPRLGRCLSFRHRRVRFRKLDCNCLSRTLCNLRNRRPHRPPEFQRRRPGDAAPARRAVSCRYAGRYFRRLPAFLPRQSGGALAALRQELITLTLQPPSCRLDSPHPQGPAQAIRLSQ